MFSRKLVTAVAGMASIVTVTLGSAMVGGVPVEVQLTSVTLIAGLGGLNVMRQGAIDSIYAKEVVHGQSPGV